MIHEENSIVVHYAVSTNESIANKGLQLEIRPLVDFREFHSTTHENSVISSLVDVGNQLVRLEPYPDCLDCT